MTNVKGTIVRRVFTALIFVSVFLVIGTIDTKLRGEDRREEVRWRSSVDRALAGDAIAAEIVGVSVALRASPSRSGRNVDRSVAALFLERAAENGLPAAKLVRMEEYERASPGLIDSLEHSNLEGFGSGTALQLASRLARVGMAQCEVRLLQKAHALRRHTVNSMLKAGRRAEFDQMSSSREAGESAVFDALCNPLYAAARLADGSPS